MNMRKIALLLTIALVLCTACSNKDTGNENSESTEQAAKSEKGKNTGDEGNDAATETVSADAAVTEKNFRSFPITDESVFSTSPVDGGTEISGCKRDIQDKVIVVPQTINGVEVVGIGKGAFVEIENVEAIVLPDSVKTIGDNAFVGLINLKYIYLGNSLKETGDMMFNYCTALETIELPEGTEKIGGSLAVSCTALKTIIVPASVTEIKGNMMENFDFSGVIKTPAGSVAEKNALDAGLTVENY